MNQSESEKTIYTTSISDFGAVAEKLMIKLLKELC